MDKVDKTEKAEEIQQKVIFTKEKRGKVRLC
jgi:hypothetical protein